MAIWIPTYFLSRVEMCVNLFARRRSVLSFWSKTSKHGLNDENNNAGKLLEISIRNCNFIIWKHIFRNKLNPHVHAFSCCGRGLRALSIQWNTWIFLTWISVSFLLLGSHKPAPIFKSQSTQFRQPYMYKFDIVETDNTTFNISMNSFNIRA